MGPQTKKRKVSKIEEINFDHDDRHQFLTGFRKRKQQRIKRAQEVAEQKNREAKREEKKRIRQERTADFQRALEEHRKQLKRLQGENSDSDGSNSERDSDEGGDQEWEGFTEPPAVDYEAEYIDEDKYTTVTVEEMDPSKEGLMEAQEDASDEDAQTTSKSDPKTEQSVGKTKKRIADSKPKKKKKKFRYENKEERKLLRAKERLSNHRKAQARRER
ncbi:hypothetical protein EYZ11_001219 [Aspergillus tanneri]|uniref:Ribosomal RNA-processing protein 17 n=1 Tax=Aspergillus tanneri TaxID=1220188 RepID=A0A4S3JVA1_9EURO|nr:uncharacterized protein ATNIH1004_011060 [Aspergillus tanneri]KAA8642119.1 hypothetical protein ATNIH1004_011060 [Aspergillus tanneri]THC99313.1 hypothetical protein EYZ11_001219 [Aspergillus tanneri]